VHQSALRSTPCRPDCLCCLCCLCSAKAVQTQCLCRSADNRTVADPATKLNVLGNWPFGGGRTEQSKRLQWPLKPPARVFQRHFLLCSDATGLNSLQIKAFVSELVPLLVPLSWTKITLPLVSLFTTEINFSSTNFIRLSVTWPIVWIYLLLSWTKLMLLNLQIINQTNYGFITLESESSALQHTKPKC
jgi:hypothetical protein